MTSLPAGARRFLQHRQDEEQAERAHAHPGAARRLGKTVHMGLRHRRTGEVLKTVCNIIAVHRRLQVAHGEEVTCKRCLKAMANTPSPTT